jgi:hypothetical protein
MQLLCIIESQNVAENTSQALIGGSVVTPMHYATGTCAGVKALQATNIATTMRCLQKKLVECIRPQSRTAMFAIS